MALVGQISDGLEGSIVNVIGDWTNMSQNDLRKMTGIPSTTFSRSVKTRFSPDQSERLVRIIRVIDRAVDLFEGNKAERGLCVSIGFITRPFSEIWIITPRSSL